MPGLAPFPGIPHRDGGKCCQEKRGTRRRSHTGQSFSEVLEGEDVTRRAAPAKSHGIFRPEPEDRNRTSGKETRPLLTREGPSFPGHRAVVRWTSPKLNIQPNANALSPSG